MGLEYTIRLDAHPPWKVVGSALTALPDGRLILEVIGRHRGGRREDLQPIHIEKNAVASGHTLGFLAMAIFHSLNGKAVLAGGLEILRAERNHPVAARHGMHLSNGRSR